MSVMSLPESYEEREQLLGENASYLSEGFKRRSSDLDDDRIYVCLLKCGEYS
jgi:hypothetical protein